MKSVLGGNAMKLRNNLIQMRHDNVLFITAYGGIRAALKWTQGRKLMTRMHAILLKWDYRELD